MPQTRTRLKTIAGWLSALMLAGTAASTFAQPQPVEIVRVSHVDQALLMFDQYDRRFVLRDGSYANGVGVTIKVVSGRMASVVGCGPDPCQIDVHALRLLKGKLSFYSEIEIPDGRYQSLLASGETDLDGASFTISDGELVELHDPSQNSPAPVDQASPEPKASNEVAQP